MTYKYLNFISMLYMTIKLSTIVLIYKIITLGSLTASASTLVMPLWFVLGDIITEVYGYKTAKQLIWNAIICQFIFAFICAGLILLKAPSNWSLQAGYDQVLGRLPRVAFASFLAIVSGAFINAYAISKWKILLRGKYFWLRSLGASAIGELIFTTVAYLTEFLGVAPFSKIIHLMLVSYGIKFLLNPILIIPSSLITIALKRFENINISTNEININPFITDLNHKTISMRTI